jgi:UDP-N-acetylmuramoyl-tripeptide--D-alanyl-D-alanine ligase
LIFSNDDEKLKALSKEINKKTLTFGLDNSSTVSLSNDNILYEEKDDIRVPVGMSFKLNYDGNSLPINIKGVLGLTQIYPLLISATVGIANKVILTDIVNALDKHIAPRGRMNLLEGIKDSIIIDDTYNSSPDALKEALNTLKRVECAGKKIAVLGDMMELGKFSVEEHKKAGIMAREIVSTLITVGQRAKSMGANNLSFDSNSSAIEYLRGIVSKGDIVLIKGSQSMRMEKIVKELLREPYRAGELLVRQDNEWLAKK